MCHHAMPENISPVELDKLLKNQNKFYLLDVRLPVEHELAAIENSTLIPLHELPHRWNEIQAEPDQTVVIYCHHGVRSWHAALYLEQQGFQKLYSLDGGIDAWSLEIDSTIPRYR